MASRSATNGDGKPPTAPPSASAGSGGAGGGGGSGAGVEHPLQSKWTLWEYREKDRKVDKAWRDQFVELFTVETVEQFWHAWTHIPKIREVFKTQPRVEPPKIERWTADKSYKRTSAVQGYAFFKQGIEPLEEFVGPDGERVTKHRRIAESIASGFDFTHWDSAWETTLLCLLGEIIDSGNTVNGACVFDKSKGPTTRIRIELWQGGTDESACDRVTENLVEVLKKEVPAWKTPFRPPRAKRKW